uniref:Uncharacterized protein n=1 Tax=Tanacetum cinerariifolium TaxID=118510 RepID=A0A699GV69_TANCI|nr:hypothetical protein [Tanacetum cinerariifolium]
MLSYSIRIIDPKSSLEKICLGDNVVVISSDKVEGSKDWYSLEYQDTAVSKGKKVVNTLSFYMMETDEISERYIASCFVNGLEAYDGEVNLEFDENLISKEVAIKLCLDYKVKKGKKLVKKELIVALKGELYFVKFIIKPEKDDSEPGVILGRSFLRLAHGVVDFGNEVITIYLELDPFEDDSEKTRKSSNDCDQLLDFNFDNVPKFGEELPLFICKMRKSNRNKKRTMENLNLPYQDIGPSSSDGNIPIDHDAPNLVGQEFLYTVGSILNTLDRLFLTFDGACHQTFRAARLDVLRTAESDSDDKEEYVIKRNSPESTPVLPQNRRTFPFFQKVRRIFYIRMKQNVPKTIKTLTNLAKSFLYITITLLLIVFGAYTPGTHDGEAGSSCSKLLRQHKTMEEVLLLQVQHVILLWEGCSRDAKSRYNTRLAQLLPRYIYSPYIVNWDVLNQTGCDGEIDDILRIRVREARSDEEIFTYVEWIRAFNINELIYAELCHEFYSTYEFDEVCVGDELQSKKIIGFRLGGRAYNLTLLEFSRRLGLYQVTKLDEEGFNVYFEGGLCSDEHFNAQAYWLSISREEHLGLSRSHTSTIRNPILRVIDKMITYGLCQRTTRYANVAWVIAKWMKGKELELKKRVKNFVDKGRKGARRIGAKKKRERIQNINHD